MRRMAGWSSSQGGARKGWRAARWRRGLTTDSMRGTSWWRGPPASPAAKPDDAGPSRRASYLSCLPCQPKRDDLVSDRRLRSLTRPSGFRQPGKGIKRPPWKARHRLLWPAVMPGAFPQEVSAMLSTHSAARKRSTRNPFLVPPWDDRHHDWLRSDAELEPHHPPRRLAPAAARLPLPRLRRASANRGSLAYPVELLLAFVLWMYSRKLTSPAAWLHQSRLNAAARWLLRGLRPARSTLYTFRDRLEPFLDDW